MDAEDEVTHASIRFYSDETNKVVIVPVKDIASFNKSFSANEPYYVKRYDGNKQCTRLSPAEVLLVGRKEDVENNAARHRFKKIRRSEVIDLIEKRNRTEPTVNKDRKAIRTKFKKMAKVSDGHKQLQKFMNTRRPLLPDDEEDVSGSDNNSENSPSLAQTEEQQDSTKSPAINQLASATSLRDSSKVNDVDTPRSSRTRLKNRPSIQSIISPPNLMTSVRKRLFDSAALNQPGPSTKEQDIAVDNGSTTRPLNESAALNEPEPSAGQDAIVNQSPTQSLNNSDRSTPRRRSRYVTIYRQKAPINGEAQEHVYDNPIEAETREINDEEKELYSQEGDEIYVGCNKMIQLAFWEYMKHRGPWVFLRELLVIYWGNHNLVNRCFKLPKVRTEINNRSPRKTFTPTKYETLRRVFKDYLDESMGHSSKKKKILRNMNKHIGYKVRDLRNSLCQKIN